MYAGSWYDSYARASIENFLGCNDRLQNQFLIMGHGTHGGPRFDARIAGDVDMGEKAPIRGNLAASRRGSPSNTLGSRSRANTSAVSTRSARPDNARGCECCC